MLSIGKLAAGQAKYYLDQAEARVDVVSSVADGIEDYYVGGLEARGEWLGRAGLELGLRGLVDGDPLRHVLAGLGPARRQTAARDVRPSARRRIRSDLLRAEERERAVRRRLADVRGAIRRSARPRGDRGGGIRRALCGGGAARPWWESGRGRQRPGGCRVPAPDVARRRSAAPHARPGREPRPRARRAVVDARRPQDLRAREDGELRLPGAYCGQSSRARSVWSGCPFGAGSVRSRESLTPSARRSVAGAPRSRPSWSSTARRVRAPRKRPPSRRGAPRIATWSSSGSPRSGERGQPTWASAVTKSIDCSAGLASVRNDASHGTS